MMSTRFIIGLSVSVFACPVSVFAVENITDECLNQVYGQLAHEERMYTSVLFGQEKSSALPWGSVRYDNEHDTWMKTGDNEWRSLNKGNTGLTWSDSTMDEQADIPERRGIFEIRQTPTSDLLPPLLQSMRALQCRLRAVCKISSLSLTSQDQETVKAQPEGCLEFEFPVFTACKQGNVIEMGAGTCDAAVDAIMDREAKLLHMVVAYDAGYRSLMQFSGTFERFLTDFRFPLLQPLWEMVRTLGALDNLSCFVGQCDE